MNLTKAKQRAATPACNQTATEVVRESLDATNWSLEATSGKLQGLERVELLLTLASSAVRIYRTTRSEEKRAALAAIVRKTVLAVGVARGMSTVDVMIHLERAQGR